jgi:hypothetical protein
MSGDGRKEFYRHLDVDKDTMKLLYAFRELKTKMLRGKDEYSNGRVYREDEDLNS